MSGTNVTDSNLAEIRGLNLNSLTLLNCSQMTDAGLGHIASIQSLQKLTLKECDIHPRLTDVGLGRLGTHKNLEVLKLYNFFT
ncbi:MAG: hypothetical protein HWD61_15825 [Parachlamydiaceae bacterium]|nr:MAG: hypothetical protein HWD61_15825 [Parachlamydiaceae bacterium]